jgi:ATP synthase protein I
VSDRPPANGLDDGPGKDPGEGRARPGRLAELDRRLAAARGAKAPVRSTRRDEYTAASMAWRMVIELVMAIVIGGAMGWGIDTLFGTMPLFLIVFVLFGLAAGVRLMLRTAAEMQRPRPGEAERGN